MAEEGNYEVEIDRQKNRLYLTLDGMLDEETARAHVKDLFAAADELEPGFDMINDISTYKPMSQAATDAIERGKEGLTDRDVNAVVRVVGDSVVSKMQFDRVGEEGYHVATAESREQAEQFLDDFRQ